MKPGDTIRVRAGVKAHVCFPHTIGQVEWTLPFDWEGEAADLTIDERGAAVHADLEVWFEPDDVEVVT